MQRVGVLNRTNKKSFRKYLKLSIYIIPEAF